MKIAKGCHVTLDYELWVDGEVVDSSKHHGPLIYEQGKGQIIQGLEVALGGREPGDQFEVDISPEDAYGLRDERAVQEIPRSLLPEGPSPDVGMTLQAKTRDGRMFRAIVIEVGPESLVIDFNHPLAGKILRFKIQVLKVDSPLAT